jgi:hypothetical protein
MGDCDRFSFPHRRENPLKRKEAAAVNMSPPNNKSQIDGCD